jgi:hypothetical protein
MRGNEIQNRFSAKVHRELIHALESARMRLSVAIAVETKSTPRDRWRYYLDTTEQVSRFIRKFRKADFELPPDSRGWIQALDRLDRLPMQIRAFRFCQLLRDIIAEIE